MRGERQRTSSPHLMGGHSDYRTVNNRVSNTRLGGLEPAILGYRLPGGTRDVSRRFRVLGFEPLTVEYQGVRRGSRRDLSRSSSATFPASPDVSSTAPRSR